MAENCFVCAVKRNNQRLFLLAFSYTKNKYDAEDIMQNCFLKLWNYEKEFVDDEHIDKWLAKVCVNECKDFFKSFFVKKSTSLDNVIGVAQFDKYFNIDLFNAVL